MRISELFQPGRAAFSFEVFPPKKTVALSNIEAILGDLQELKPDFISVTHGAGGGAAGEQTCRVSAMIKRQYGIEPLAHLTCLNLCRAEVDEALDSLKESGIENVLALRGDPNPERAPKTDFLHASDLISHIARRGGFHISAACYPEGHIESPNAVSDILNLKKKTDAGAEHLISQLFFDNDLFYSFLEKARIAGISVPIEAGVMPVVNKKQIEKMVSLCGAGLPKKFRRILNRYEHSAEALRDAGIAYAVDQIVDLIANGVDGVHLYTMNAPRIARRISGSIGSLLERSA